MKLKEPYKLIRIVNRNLKCTYSTGASENVFSYAAGAEFLTAAGSSSSIPKLRGLPEVVVTGRANVGKSTLLNAVIGRKDLLNVSKKAGRTQTLNFYRIGNLQNQLVLVDSPGYGRRGRMEWGDLWTHYVTNREELRRIYVLVNAPHGLTDFDKAMLDDLHMRLGTKLGTSITLQAIVTKIDKLPPKNAASNLANIKKSLFDVAPYCLPPILTAVELSTRIRIGVEAVRKSIAEACMVSGTP